MTRKPLLLIGMALLLFTGCLVKVEIPEPITDCDSNPVYENSHVNSDELNAVMEKAVGAGLTGAVALIKSAEKGTFMHAVGAADLENGAPMQACQQFRVASLTKIFTATATLLLVEEGVISLDNTIAELLDIEQYSGIQGSEVITLAQLLNHTSGVPNYDDDIRFAPMVLNAPGAPIKLEDKLALVRSSGGRVPDWVIRKFGQIYSNTNYLLLQLIIEKHSGLPYEAFIRKEIIEPLGLSSTLFGTEEAYPQGLATGYVDFYGNGKMRNVNSWDAHRFQAEGDLISTANDLMKFFEGLLKGSLLKKATLELMKTQRLGLLQEEFFLENAMGHDGIAIGYSAELWYLPRSELMVVLLSNQGRLVFENESVLQFENLLRDLIGLGK